MFYVFIGLQAHGMLRKANILTHSKQNERAGFGWALEGMLKAEGQGNVVTAATDATSGGGNTGKNAGAGGGNNTTKGDPSATISGGTMVKSPPRADPRRRAPRAAAWAA
jgi:hypothetical protein